MGLRSPPLRGWGGFPDLGAFLFPAPPWGSVQLLLGTKSLGGALLGGCGLSGREARSPGAEDAACPFREKGCALWRKALEP